MSAYVHQPEAPLQTRSALVIFSGGQDSATCLAWALSRFSSVQTIGFDYGQRHAVELQCRANVRKAVAALRPDWGQRLGADTLLGIDLFHQLADNALTSDMPIDGGTAGGVPNTFVPGRNLIFILHAAAWAYQRDIRHLVLGVCQADSSGYPDCRDDSIKALQVAVNLGMDSRYTLHTPLMFLDKAATWRLAEELGGQPLVDVILEESHTCYEGERGRRFAWGYGCGVCPACLLRRRGYEAYMAEKQEKEPEAPALREDV
ncbi:MAG: 7-cyano-7-deazaguanine synthase QueC [Desulfovibrio sp.]|uniref:7-cyano-7-deazaguanine synthase QueC n=1 Tax=Desulfovibrio sp. TaxID=885 RepID=UPI0025C4055C|nr:7-cyano-7-deazaguanine synthase QueC [Desulfovibrio sp.]MCI7568187.1 7-cyano-7-deazaguanine synthase QueC [Desulfovibrio sp.]